MTVSEDCIATRPMELAVAVAKVGKLAYYKATIWIESVAGYAQERSKINSGVWIVVAKLYFCQGFQVLPAKSVW